MINVNDIKRTVGHALLIVIAITMAACGGGDKKNNKKCIRWGSIAGLPACWELSTGNAPPTQGPTSNSKAESVSADSASSPFVNFDEYETNSLLENANVVTLTAESTDSLSGIEIIGSVHAIDDAADYFVLTPNRSSSYDLFLCGENCTDIRQSDAVYLMVYDQSQTTIASTPLGDNVTQKLTVNLAAGLAYYIEVNGYNAVDVVYDYRLVITD